MELAPGIRAEEEPNAELRHRAGPGILRGVSGRRCVEGLAGPSGLWGSPLGDPVGEAGGVEVAGGAAELRRWSWAGGWLSEELGPASCRAS